MTEGTWSSTELTEAFVDKAYESVKGRVRTHVLHQHLLEHLPSEPVSVLDVGGGAGHQSLLLALAGHELTLLDSSAAMLDRARRSLSSLPDEVQARVTLVEADGLVASEALGGRSFDAVLSHGVLGYLDGSEPMVDQLCRCLAPGGIVSIMTGNAATMAVRPAMEQRWSDALASFDRTTEIGVLGVPSRADTVEAISELLVSRGVAPVQWYGGWLFVDWLEFAGRELDPHDAEALAATIQVEMEASRRDPYRRLSRVFHLVGRQA
jgi:SAM-dependent methyltransferase